MGIDDSSKRAPEDASWVRVLDRQNAPCPVCGYNLYKNTSGTCSECGTRLSLAVVPVSGPDRRPTKGLLQYVRIGIIVVCLVPISLALATFLSDLISGHRFVAMEILLPTFGAATLLGIATLASLFVVRKIHFTVSAVFFGFLALIIVVNISSELLSGITYPSTGAALAEYGLMFGFLLLNIAGLGVEIMCERKSRAQTLLENGTS